MRKYNYEDEVVKSIKKNKLIVGFISIILGIIGLIGLIFQKFIVAIIGIGLMGLLICALVKVDIYKLDKYEVGKGFKFYRKSPEEKIKTYTYTQVFMAIVIVITIVIAIVILKYRGLSWLAYAFSGIIFFETFFKKRIKVHTPIDDSILFELEERKIIKTEDVVKALYKDFKSWNYLKVGNKIVVLTVDRIIEIKFITAKSYKRIEYPLAKIERLNVLSIDDKGKGLVIFLGMRNGQFFNIKIDGESIYDSPEEFMSIFLKTLDEALIRTNSIKNSQNNNSNKNISNSIDKSKEEKNGVDSLEISNESKVNSNNTRYIDF